MRKIVKVAAIAICVLGLPLILNVGIAHYKDGSQQNRGKESQKMHKKSEEEIIAKYIKLRNSRIPVELAEIQSKMIAKKALQYNINPSLIVSIIEKESMYDPTRVSPLSAKGLMQILRCDGVDIDNDAAHDIGYNIETGIKILLKKLELKNWDTTSALTAYSGGAKDYSNSIYEGVGRYSMYRDKEMNELPEIVVNEE